MCIYLLCEMNRGSWSLSLWSKGNQSITAEVIKSHNPIGFVTEQVGRLPQRNLGSQYWPGGTEIPARVQSPSDWVDNHCIRGHSKSYTCDSTRLAPFWVLCRCWHQESMQRDSQKELEWNSAPFLGYAIMLFGSKLQQLHIIDCQSWE